MLEVNQLNSYLANKIKNRCLKLLSKKQDKEYFLVFSGLLEILRFEYNKGFISKSKNKIISYDLKKLEYHIYKSIFNELFRDSDATQNKLKEGINGLIYNRGENHLRLIPYLVNNSDNTFKNNIGNRGFAGKLRDDQKLRTNNTCIIIFDVDPIETLKTASDGNILKRIFTKNKLKRDFKDNNAPNWYNELVKCFFNDNILHSLNIIDRLKRLCELKNDKYQKEINYYISKYNLPLFYINRKNLKEDRIIKDNYKLYCKVNNKKIEPVSMNFKKKVLDKLNFAYLPESIDEKKIEKILRNESLHLSSLYNLKDFNYKIAKNVFGKKGPSKIKGLDIKPNNELYKEINSTKKKIEGVLNKGNLKKLKVNLKGKINNQDKLYIHYYYNNLNKKNEQIGTHELIDSKCELTLKDVKNYELLNIIINKDKNKLTKALFKGKFILQEQASQIIIPEVEGELELKDGELYPTLVMENAEDIKEIKCNVIKELGKEEKKNCKVTRDETLEEGKIKYNLSFNNEKLTKIIIREEYDKPDSHKHLLHFVSEKGKEAFENIKLKSEQYTSFVYKNKLYKYEVDSKFTELLRRYDINNLNEIYKKLLNNPNQYYLVAGEDFKECISPQANDILKIRSEILKEFKSIYESKNIDLFDSFNELYDNIKFYLTEFSKAVKEVPELVKVDTIEIGDKRVLSPFAPLNLSFYLHCWDNAFENKELLNNADNSEAFKYIQGEDGWYVAQNSPAFLWLYYVPEKATNSYGVEKYLSSVIKNKIKHLSEIYPYLFSTSKQTIHIGILNPGDSRFVLEGLKSYFKYFKRKGDENELPHFHISLIYQQNQENSYCQLDELFETGTDKTIEETCINKVSYSKKSFKNLNDNENYFYHLFFIKDLFKVDNNSVNMFNQEDQYLNTYFANGFSCHPLTKSQYRANHVTYTSYNNYVTYLNKEKKTEFGKILEETNAFYPQAFSTNIAKNNHKLRTVNVTPEDIPDKLINQSFMATFLDREIDIDIFNSEKMKKVEKPFLVDYSNYSSVKKGSNEDVKFLTITNQKKPFIELFKHVLREYNAIKEPQVVLKSLFSDLNLLNGFWVLDLLGNNNNFNKIKGILGTLAAFRVLKNSLKNDRDKWHIIIGIEELMGIVPGYSKNIAMRFNDEEKNNFYCDDLAVISFSKDLIRKNDFSIQVRLIEVKNSSNAKYVCKGFKQLEQTEERLEKYFMTNNNEVNSFRNKEVVNWIIYNLNKYKIFDDDYLNLVDNSNSNFFQNLKILIDKLNHGEINVKIEPGILINVNSTNKIIDKVEIKATRDYLLLHEDDFVEILNDNSEIQFNKISKIFNKNKSFSENKKNKAKEILNKSYINESNNKDIINIEENDPNNEKSKDIVKKEVINKNFKSFIGRKITSSEELVFYDPKCSGDNLSNMNVMITGSPGKGKTQLLKSMILQERKQGVNFLIFDFKNDFGDEEFLKQSNLEYVNLEFEGLPYNPLIPPKKQGRKNSYLNAAAHSIAISGVLKSVYKLGTQQEATFKEILREVYGEYGINAYGGSMEYSNNLKFPVLNEVANTLREENKKAYARLDTIFSYNMFKEDFRDVSLSDLLSESYVFNLSSIANDEVKNAIAKILVVSAHQYLNSLPHSQNMKNIFVFDEAHRFLGEPKLESLIRECRAYGLGVWVSSQFPDDYPDEIAGALETKIIHGNGSEDKRIRTIKKLTGFDGRDDIIKDLDLFESIFVNKHYGQALIQNLTYPHALILIETFNKNSVKADSRINGVESVRQKELINHLIDMNLLKSIKKEEYVLTKDGEKIIQYFL
ncbi:MAG: type IV secretion system DNA-binding domain-containing protein [Bacillota bacterium]